MSTTDLPGPSLLAGRYRLVERLGAGGMSVVWRGFDEVLGRQVAVKVLPRARSADRAFRRRLRAEAQAAARLSHPHITNVYDYGETTPPDGGEPLPFVVMELIDGDSLAGVLGRVRHLPWPAAVRICSDVAAALAAAHARGIVHRDVTPANVMLTSAGAKVVDFGISALIGEDDLDDDGSLLGTPAYLAPERLVGGQVSPATDVYAVGLLIYRTLVGQLPWDVGTTTALLRAHQYTEPEPLPPVEGLPRAVSALVARCLEKLPDDRPSSAELAHVLAGIVAELPKAPVVRAPLTDEERDTTILPWQQGVAAPPDTPPAGAPAAAGRAARASAGAVYGGPQVASAGSSAGAAAGTASAGPSPAGSGPRDGHPPVPAAAPLPGGTPLPAGVAVHSVAGADTGAPLHDAEGSAMRPLPVERPVPVAKLGNAAKLTPGSRGAPGAKVVPAVPAQRAGGTGADLAGPGDDRHDLQRPAAPQDGWDGTDQPTAGRDSAVPESAVPGAAATRSDGFGGARNGGPGDRHPGERGGGSGSDGPRGPGGPPGPGRPTGYGGSYGEPPHSRRVARRRLFVAVGAAVAVAAAGYGWTVWNGASTGGTGAALAATPPPRSCFVTYAVLSDTGRAFEAGLLLTNNSAVPIEDWDLRFVMPGDQQVSAKGAVTIKQEGHDVTAASSSVIQPLRTMQVDLTGGYRANNAPPMLFALDGQLCEVLVSAKPGAPAKLVPNSPSTRVDPGGFPTTVPGGGVPTLSTGPGGIVVTVAPDPPATETAPSSDSPTSSSPSKTTAAPPSPPPAITESPTTDPPPPPPPPPPMPEENEESGDGAANSIGETLDDLV